MKTLVTGGTGFLGEHLVRHLVECGDSVRVLSRGSSPALEELGVEWVTGDVVRDLDVPHEHGPAPQKRSLKALRPSLNGAVEDCEVIYHLAGFVSREREDSQRMMRLHVDGTRRVLEAAKEAGVRRVVVASTSGTIAVSKEPMPLDETAPYPIELVGGWPYYLSKIYQEKLALDLGQRLGLEIVVVNPSLLLGPGDARSSSTGDVRRFLRRELPVIPKGGLNFVDARDVAVATRSAAFKGQRGDRYLLGGPNWSCEEFFGRLERVSKVRRPLWRLPEKIQLGGATLIEHAYKTLGRIAPFDRASVEMGQLFWYCDSSKAAQELDFVIRDPGETLDETVRDVRARML
jgi:dihydroflavonol-4-reductase